MKQEKHEESVASKGNNQKLYKYVRQTLESKLRLPLLEKADAMLCSSNQEAADTLSEASIKVNPLQPIILMRNAPPGVQSLCHVGFSLEPY